MNHGERDDGMVSVRLALLEDLDELCEMMSQFNATEGIPWTRASAESPLRTLLGDDTLGVVVLCEIEQEIAGYAVMTWGFDLEWGGRDAYLTELFIEPEHRRQGAGQALLHHLELVARDHDAMALHLLVHDDNMPARALYMRRGFRDSPRLFMSKEL